MIRFHILQDKGEDMELRGPCELIHKARWVGRRGSGVALPVRWLRLAHSTHLVALGEFLRSQEMGEGAG